MSSICSLRRVALITVVTAQDAAYIAEFVLAKGYRVQGPKRRASSCMSLRIGHVDWVPDEGDLDLRLRSVGMKDAENLDLLMREMHLAEIDDPGARMHVGAGSGQRADPKMQRPPKRVHACIHASSRLELKRTLGAAS